MHDERESGQEEVNVIVHGSGMYAIDGEDVATAIRTGEIDQAAAIVARQPRVRETLIARQRAAGARGGVVMEGRDIGTVVFPSADVKIFLDASPEERARRRATDPATALAERDRIDSTRAASPLKVADDAVVIDTTALSIEDAVARVMEIVEKKSIED